MKAFFKHALTDKIFVQKNKKTARKTNSIKWRYILKGKREEGKKWNPITYYNTKF